MQVFKRILASVTVMLLLISTLPARAQQAPTGSGLSISPTISEFTMRPGQADKVDITLKNITVNAIVAQAAVNDFDSDNVTGNPRIVTDPTKQSANSIKDFVLGLEDVPLAVGEQKKVSVSLQIPAKTPAGAYYGVIRYKAVPAVAASATAPGQVSLSASVGTIVLVTIPGNIHEQVQLTKLHIFGGTKEKPRDAALFFTKPTQAGVTVRNLGNGFAKPFGTVEIHRTLGGTVYTYQLNNAQPRANVLPNSSRTFINPIKNIKYPGRYTMIASVSYGSGSDVLVLKKSFWYIPGWLAITLLVILAILIVLTLLAYRRYRGGENNRHSHYG
jgi:hypothetical protein